MPSTIFPYDEHGNFVYAAGELTIFDPPVLLRSLYPAYIVKPFTFPSDLKNSAAVTWGGNGPQGATSVTTVSSMAWLEPDREATYFYDSLSAAKDFADEPGADNLDISWVDYPQFTPTAIDFYVATVDDYTGAELYTDVTPRSWVGRAVLDLEIWAQEHREDARVINGDFPVNEYPAYGNRSGLIASLPVHQAIELFANHHEFVVEGTLTDVEIKDRLTDIVLLSVKVENGELSVKGNQSWPWANMYENISLTDEPQLIAAHDHLSAYCYSTLDTIRPRNEELRELRAKQYREHVITSLPSMISAVGEKDIKESDMRLRREELTRAVSFAITELTAAEFNRIPAPTRVALPALHEQRPLTAREQVSGYCSIVTDLASKAGAFFAVNRKEPARSTSPVSMDDGPSM